ncbi:MAG: hypothetical protein DRO23_12565 [Thermoprotei archaeon]|nr:MAG: hypothetical protein DRO23_12565 [Thermoprotei archaeon]
MAWSRYVSLAIVALIVLSILNVLSAVPISAQKDNLRVRVAKMVLNGVSKRVDAILSLAEKYGIELTENMTKRVELCKNILENATEIVEEEPCKAVRMAVKACWVFKPVALYVLENIPEEDKETLRKNILLRAIGVRENAVERLRSIVSWLEDKGIEVPDEVKENIDNAENLLTQARELVESGTYNVTDVKKLIGEASKVLAKATVSLHRITGGIWRKATLVNFSLLRLGRVIIGISQGINATIEAIEENKTDEALETMSKIIDAMDRTAKYLENAINFTEARGINENLTVALKALRDSVIEAKQHVEDAKSSLEEGDALTALSELETALNTITVTIEEYKHVFMRFHRYVEVLLTVSGKIHIEIGRRIRYIALRKAARLVFCLEKIDMKLHAMYKLYQEGKISEEEFHSALNKAKTFLENLKERLEKLPRPPKAIIGKIDRILQWIESVYSE